MPRKLRRDVSSLAVHLFIIRRRYILPHIISRTCYGFNFVDTIYYLVERLWDVSKLENKRRCDAVGTARNFIESYLAESMHGGQSSVKKGPLSNTFYGIFRNYNLRLSRGKI